MKRYTQTFLAALATGAILLSVTPAHASTLVASERLIDGLRNGIPQDVYVTLDSDAINSDLAKMRAARGLLHDDRQIVEESCRRYAQMKKRLFGRRGMESVHIILDFECLATVKVRIFDLAGLALLLRQPMVTNLSEPFQVTTTG